MPLIIQAATWVVPPRFFVSSLRAIIVKGADIAVVWPNLLAMVILGTIFYALAMHNTRKMA